MNHKNHKYKPEWQRFLTGEKLKRKRNVEHLTITVCDAWHLFRHLEYLDITSAPDFQAKTKLVAARLNIYHHQWYSYYQECMRIWENEMFKRKLRLLVSQ